MTGFLPVMSNLPNLHAALLHFPIVLLLLAFPLELLSLLRRKPFALRILSWAALWGGTAAATAAYWSGRAAADGLGVLDVESGLAVSEHSDAALRTLWIFGVVAAGQLALVFLRGRTERTSLTSIRIALLAVMAVGVWSLVDTADRGGGLVYGRGLAVRATSRPVSAPTPPSPTGDAVSVDADGLYRDLVVDLGGGERPPADAAIVADGRFLLLLPESTDDVVVLADVDLSDFEGKITLMHHYHGPADHEGFSIGPEGAALFVQSAAGRSELDHATAGHLARRIRIAVSAAGSHLKGYIDGATLVHGHRDAPKEEGRVGLELEGEGAVRIHDLHLQVPKGEH